MFHSNVKLPEGKSPFNCKSPFNHHPEVQKGCLCGLGHKGRASWVEACSLRREKSRHVGREFTGAFHGKYHGEIPSIPNMNNDVEIILTRLTKNHGFVGCCFFSGIGLHGIKPWIKPWIPWISYGDMVWGPGLSHPREFSGILLRA